MKTRTISRILEGIFLFTLILMIYIMSIFNAKGQMMMDFDTPTELMLSYSNEESFIQERMMNMNYPFFKSVWNEKPIEDRSFFPDYIIQNGKPLLDKRLLELSEKPQIMDFTEMGIKRRRSRLDQNQLQAPQIVILL